MWMNNLKLQLIFIPPIKLAYKHERFECGFQNQLFKK